MDSSPPSNTQLSPTLPASRSTAQIWRALPRLLVSRRWRWLTLGAILLALLLIRLGFWQLSRLAERRANNAVVAARLAAPPIALTGAETTNVPEAYQTVTVRGTFDPANQIVLRNRTRGGVPGSDIVTPLRIAGSDRAVLVDRGWVPLLQYDAAALAQWTPTGEVALTGIARTTQVATQAYGPRDVPEAGQPLQTWFRVDISQIGKQVPYALLPFWVEALPDAAAPDLPHPQPDLQLTEGSHLSYAAQWFSFALIGIVGYAALVVKSEGERTAAAQQPAAPTE